ncbi:MAG: hypothetical protein PH343_07955 [Nitrospira sp.]|nr:hypothetical protein [Nitrospira sp.]
MAYQFEGDQVNITSLASGYNAATPAAIQYHSNRITCIYEKGSLLYVQYSDDRGLTWSGASQIVNDTNAKEPCICRNYFDGWALVWNAYTDEGSFGGFDWEIKFTQALAKMSIVEDIVSASISKGIDMNANGLNVSIAQEKSKYDFQRKSIWQGQLNPGSAIELFIGLGEYLDRRFKGYIDNVKYDDLKDVLSISARGRPAILIDNKLGQRLSYGTNKTYKQIIIDLITKAGLEDRDFYVEDTSVKPSEERIFERDKTYMNAINELAGDLGWIIYEDEDGKIYVRSPQNSQVNSWNYFRNVNCFTLKRNIDKSGIPYKVVVFNEEAGIEKSAIVNTHNWIALDENNIEYLSSDDTNPASIQATANNIAEDYALKIFTIDIMVPLNFYIQIRDRVTVFNENLSVSNKGIVINITENLGKSLTSTLTLAVIE